MKPDNVKCENCDLWALVPIFKGAYKGETIWEEEGFCHYSHIKEKKDKRSFCSHFTEEWPCKLCGSGLDAAGDCPQCDAMVSEKKQSS